MAKRSTLRASDEDRERVADRLRHAAGEGRLLAEELEERLEGVFAARTYGQLSALVADLPAPREGSRHVLPLWMRASLILAAVLVVIVAVAIAAAVLVAFAGLWMVCIAVGWCMFGRGRHIPLAGHPRTLANAARYARTGAGATRGGRAPL